MLQNETLAFFFLYSGINFHKIIVELFSDQVEVYCSFKIILHVIFG